MEAEGSSRRRQTDGALSPNGPLDVLPPDSLLPVEWLCLFPAPPAPPAPHPWRAAAADPAAPAREARPLTRDVLLRSLSPWPLLRILARVHLWLTPLIVRPGIRIFVTSTLPNVALVVALWHFNGVLGAFSYPHMVAGTTAICISQFFLLVTFLVGMFRTELSSNAGHGETRPEGKREAGPAPVSLDHHSCAGFSRWSALAVFAGTNGGLEKLGDDARAQTPWLVRHQPGDRLCPCAARSCGGEVVRSAAAMWLLHATVFWMFGTAVLIMRTYTQLVYFGSLLWNSWWAFFAVWFLIGNSFVQIFLHFFARPAAIAPLQLAHRLQHRACSAAIRSLMYKLERCAEGSDPPPTSQELYVQLHRRLTIQWRSLFVLSANSDKSIFSIMAVELSGAVIYMIFGACLPAWCIIIQLFYFSHILGDLISVAAANSQIDDIVELYTAARQDILGLLVDVRDPPTAALMQHHADLLDSFRDVGLLRARFLGVSVTVGTVRSLIVALVPILAALWTVLRGLGVSFTPQTICPG